MAFRLTNKAKADLRNIARFTEQRWGKAQRNTYLLQIDQCFHQLAENPSIGKACDDIRPGYRKMPQGSHVVFYREANDTAIEIIRILHQSMDVDSKISGP